MNPAPSLFLIGPMGAGKTTVGRRVASQLGLDFFDLDHEIEERSGATISRKIISPEPVLAQNDAVGR